MICLTLIRLISCELRNENETEATELGTECAMFIVWHYSPHRRGARPVEKNQGSNEHSHSQYRNRTFLKRKYFFEDCVASL